MGRHLNKTKRSISAQKIEAKKRLAHYADLETRREIRAAVAEWKYTDPLYREPDTLKALARSLGISYATVRRYMSSLPNTLEEYLDMVRRNLLARSLGTMARMADGKTAQAVASGKIILENLLKPEWNKKPEKTPVMPKAVQDAFAMIRGKQIGRTPEAEGAESKPVDEGKPSEQTDRH